RLLRQPGVHPQSLGGLQEDDERCNEEAGYHGKAVAAVKPRQDDGQIIETEERVFLLDQRADDEQRRDEQKHEDALEGRQDELLKHKALGAKGVERAGTKVNDGWAICK